MRSSAIPNFVGPKPCRRREWASQRDPVFGKFHVVPGDIFDDVIFRLALGVDFHFDGAGGVERIALNAADIEAARL